MYIYAYNILTIIDCEPGVRLSYDLPALRSCNAERCAQRVALIGASDNTLQLVYNHTV